MVLFSRLKVRYLVPVILAHREKSVHQKNIEIIQDLYRSFREKDYAGFRSLCAPDVEWRETRADEPPGEIMFRSVATDWAQSGFKINRFLTADNAVLVIGRYVGRARLREGAATSTESVHVYFLRDGKVTRFQQYADARVLWDAASLS
jgi:uncharacterized protein